MLIPIIVLCATITAKVRSQDIYSCDLNEDIVQEYRKAMNSFLAFTYRNAFLQTNYQFVYAPLSAWLTMAAIAEGAKATEQERLFQLLGVPKDRCHRIKFYQLATSRFYSGYDVSILSTRLLVIDKQVNINPIYQNYIFQNSLLNVLSAPLKDDPLTSLNEMRRITSAELLNIDVSGNSVLLDKVDYQGLWSMAFEDAIEERAPFYSVTGERLGSVDLMKVKRRVRIAYFQSFHCLSIELEIGNNNRYRLIVGIIPEKQSVNNFQGSIINEFLKTAQESELINIAVPRFNLTSEINIKKIFEGYEIDDLWSDPTWTTYISEPAAMPSDFVQRASLSLNPAGLRPAAAAAEPSNLDVLGFDSVYTQDFILNRPFIMGIFDAETYTCLISAAFTKPTYKD